MCNCRGLLLRWTCTIAVLRPLDGTGGYVLGKQVCCGGVVAFVTSLRAAAQAAQWGRPRGALRWSHAVLGWPATMSQFERHYAPSVLGSWYAMYSSCSSAQRRRAGSRAASAAPPHIVHPKARRMHPSPHRHRIASGCENGYAVTTTALVESSSDVVLSAPPVVEGTDTDFVGDCGYGSEMLLFTASLSPPS